MVVTCGQHMAHVIQYNPFNNYRITIRLKTCECVRVSQRTNHARGAIFRRSPGVAFPKFICIRIIRSKKVLLLAIIIISRRIGTEKAFTIAVEGLKITSKEALKFSGIRLDHVLKYLVHQFATRFHLVSAFGD